MAGQSAKVAVTRQLRPTRRSIVADLDRQSFREGHRRWIGLDRFPARGTTVASPTRWGKRGRSS